MEVASKEYIINTVFRTNILPLISECNTSCIFCSHKQNPEDVEVFRLPKMGISDFNEILDFISPNKKLVIGESATRIIEGEPLLHKEFIEIVTLIRNRFRHMPIQITTNGILLDEAMVERLVELGGIELYISVNCVDPEKRKKVLSLKKEHDIRKIVGIVKDRLKFSGSCVIIPGILDWDDIEEIIGLLDWGNADSVRLFLPGYTYRAKESADLAGLHEAAIRFAEKIRGRYRLPIIVEPSFIRDLDCRVEGVVKNSPAFSAGIKTGDIITHVNGSEVKTRVDGFNKLFKAVNPVLKIQREGKTIDLKLAKGRNTPPGFAVLYDIDPDIAGQVVSAAAHHKASKVLVVTSELAYDTLRNLFKDSSFPFEYKIEMAHNSFFGGNIKCAGLLTNQDILSMLEEYLRANEKPDLILLPPVMFDFKRRDLLGRPMKEIEEKLGITVDTV